MLLCNCDLQVKVRISTEKAYMSSYATITEITCLSTFLGTDSLKYYIVTVTLRSTKVKRQGVKYTRNIHKFLNLGYKFIRVFICSNPGVVGLQIMTLQFNLVSY